MTEFCVVFPVLRPGGDARFLVKEPGSDPQFADRVSETKRLVVTFDLEAWTMASPAWEVERLVDIVSVIRLGEGSRTGPAGVLRTLWGALAAFGVVTETENRRLQDAYYCQGPEGVWDDGAIDLASALETLWRILSESELSPAKMARLLSLEMPLQRVLSDATRRGVMFNRSAFSEQAGAMFSELYRWRNRLQLEYGVAHSTEDTEGLRRAFERAGVPAPTAMTTRDEKVPPHLRRCASSFGSFLRLHFLASSKTR